jgi:hypothetical protein
MERLEFFSSFVFCHEQLLKLLRNMFEAVTSEMFLVKSICALILCVLGDCFNISIDGQKLWRIYDKDICYNTA